MRTVKKSGKPVVDARGCNLVAEFGRREGRGDACNNEATDSDPGEPNAGSLVLICDSKCVSLGKLCWSGCGL